MTLNALVGDSGNSLSGGQQQRILLARALYRNPRMLFLDEATSHRDIDTERRILDKLVGSGITIISVAHRPDVLARADRIIQIGSYEGTDPYRDPSSIKFADYSKVAAVGSSRLPSASR